MIKLIVLILPIMLVVGCSDEQNKVEEHVWKEQTEMIDKAKDIEQMLNDAALQQQKRIEQQTQ
ncbi:MAG: hypothetical protein COA83_03150 [Methylophaga sp.]|nr:MAG: hypothetical protein COA83_03150 [Methylophaga sp.]